jgi:hypothetical protein
MRTRASLAALLFVCCCLLVLGTTCSATGGLATHGAAAVQSRQSQVGLGRSVAMLNGDSIASSLVRFERASPPCPDAYAEYMSVGPLGAALPDLSSRSGDPIIDSPRQRLRVTIGRSESSVMLTIDEILTGRADSRRVVAEYRIRPYSDFRDLWSALLRAPRVLGSEPLGPPIVWQSPTAFSWITRSDTLVFEQQAGPSFLVTIRARVR